MAHSSLKPILSQILKISIPLGFCLLNQVAIGQTSIYLKHGYGKPLPEPMYLAGDFNQWNPADSNFQFVDGKLVLKLDQDSIAAKLTGGSWDLAEANADGSPRPNRNIKLYKDSIITLHFYSFEDQSDRPPRGVQLITDSAAMSFKEQFRKVWVYLPKGYEQSKTNYPVLYLQDGQNLFRGIKGSAVKWQVASCLDSLQLNLIVVGISHGESERINELSPYPQEKYGGGEAKAYFNFLNQKVIPFIDSNFRTLKQSEYRLIGGSSLGGLFSMWALREQAQRFGGALIFSPAYWFNPEVMEAKNPSESGRRYIYQSCGDQEGSTPKTVVGNMLKMDSLLQGEQTQWIIQSNVVAGGEHNEQLWQEEFPKALIWFFEQAPFKNLP
jgi:predicted alpha/beta superfamily hydrolase